MNIEYGVTGYYQLVATINPQYYQLFGNTE